MNFTCTLKSLRFFIFLRSSLHRLLCIMWALSRPLRSHLCVDYVQNNLCLPFHLFELIIYYYLSDELMPHRVYVCMSAASKKNKKKTTILFFDLHKMKVLAVIDDDSTIYRYNQSIHTIVERIRTMYERTPSAKSVSEEMT